MRELGANADITDFADADGLRASLDMIARHGYSGILLYLAQGLPFLQRHLNDVQAALRSSGLNLLQLHAAWPSLIDADPAARELALTEHMQWAELAVAAGACSLIVHPTGTAISGMYLHGEGALAVLADSYRRLATAVQGSTLVLAIENDCARPDEPDRGVVGGCMAELAALCDAIDCEEAGICLDVSHCWANGEDPVDACGCAGNRVVTTHIHDTTGLFDRHLPPGAGITDWRRLLSALPDTVPLVLEVIPQQTPAAADEVLANAMSFLLETSA